MSKFAVGDGVMVKAPEHFDIAKHNGSTGVIASVYAGVAAMQYVVTMDVIVTSCRRYNFVPGVTQFAFAEGLLVHISD